MIKLIWKNLVLLATFDVTKALDLLYERQSILDHDMDLVFDATTNIGSKQNNHESKRECQMTGL